MKPRRRPKAQSVAELVRRLHLRDALIDSARKIDSLPRLGREVFLRGEAMRSVCEFVARDLELVEEMDHGGSTLEDNTSLTWTDARRRAAKYLAQELRARARRRSP